MSKVITEGSTVKCAHQGTVKFTASQQVLKVDNQAVLVTNDVSTGLISGCKTPLDPQTGTKPCLKVMSLSAGAATKLKAGNAPVLLETATGITDGVAKTPNTWSVQSAGQTKLDAI
jgi:hypothetical protein